MFQLFQRPTCPLLRDSSELGYLKKNTIYPGESVSGFVYVAWIKGERAVFIIRIEGAEYIYEWGFDKKNAFLLNKNN